MEGLAHALLEVTVYSGIIWAATLLFKKAFRNRLSPSMHLAIWLLFVGRLLMPVTLKAPFHVLPALPAVDVSAVQTNLFAAPASVSLEETGAEVAPDDSTHPRQAPRTMQETAFRPLQTHKAEGRNALTPAQWIVLVWLTGIAVGVFAAAITYRKLHAISIENSVYVPDEVADLFVQCQAELGIQCHVTLLMQRHLRSPALLFPRTVLLPDHVLRMGREKTRFALLHELMHLKRKDNLRTLGLLILRIIYWFNPFVWLALPMICDDIEIACDRDVTCSWDALQRKAYAMTIVSMFETPQKMQPVLNLASGGRKAAEKRIRGIFMIKKTKTATKGFCLLMAATLGMCCFTTACQPAPSNTELALSPPEQETKTILIDDADDATAIHESADKETRDSMRTSSHSVGVSYAPEQHWSEILTPVQNVQIAADTDVLVPEGNVVYPVWKLQKGQISQDKLNLLAARLVGDVPVYQPPVAFPKARLEEELAVLREELAKARAHGDTSTAESLEWTILGYEDALENATEEGNLIPADFAYCPYDWETGQSVTDHGANYVDVVGMDADGEDFEIMAQGKPDEFTDAYFEYAQGGYVTESDDRRCLAKKSQGEAEGSDADAHRQEIEARIATYENGSIDMDAMQTQAEQLLAELGIEDVRIISAERATYAPNSRMLDIGAHFSGSDTKPAAVFQYVKEVAGIPCMVPYESEIEAGESAYYSAPFGTEQGIIVLTTDGKVRWFSWENPCEMVETVAEDSEILRFDKAKDKLVSEMTRTYSSLADETTPAVQMQVNDVRLVMSYVNAPDESDKVLAIPAWYADASVTLPKENLSRFPHTDTMISALDGAPILEPGYDQVDGRE